ncbi:hypothetical protein EDB19DRAFT_2026758 [Suillus lakei]|nr:hypothetical protein EDB19DRAFT_2026758 [Suillus lakei]
MSPPQNKVWNIIYTNRIKLGSITKDPEACKVGVAKISLVCNGGVETGPGDSKGSKGARENDTTRITGQKKKQGKIVKREYHNINDRAATREGPRLVRRNHEKRQARNHEERTGKDHHERPGRNHKERPGTTTNSQVGTTTYSQGGTTRKGQGGTTTNGQGGTTMNGQGGTTTNGQGGTPRKNQGGSTRKQQMLSSRGGGNGETRLQGT